MIAARRYHDISCGHRVVGHEGKCAHLHGHNYRIHFTVVPVDGVDPVGRVLDFAVIKDRLCSWLEIFWDHRLLIWEQDPLLPELQQLDPQGVMVVEFNPTAENMAKYLVEEIGPQALLTTDTILIKVTVEETRKCSASYELPHSDQ